VGQTRARVFEPHVHEVRAELARLSDEGSTFEREISEAQRLFTAIGATGHAARLAREIG
jgi:hypothetical protein